MLKKGLIYFFRATLTIAFGSIFVLRGIEWSKNETGIKTYRNFTNEPSKGISIMICPLLGYEKSFRSNKIKELPKIQDFVNITIIG